MNSKRRLILAAAAFVTSLCGQWSLQESHSTAGLRGLHSLSPDIAWASGTRGTVLRTTDGGATWQTCAIPPNADKLDFRGVQALDANTAIVMSSGKGDLSRLYKTTDACRTWKLVFSNPDADGFWDGIRFDGAKFGALIGDPVGGRFPVFVTADRGDTWQPFARHVFAASDRQSLFAASNTSLLVDGKNQQLFVITGGGVTSFMTATADTHLDLASGEAAGAFSIASRTEGSKRIFVVVGGDYKQPDQTAGTACYSTGDGMWHTAQTPPHGYRSAVAWDADTKSWIAVGPNGSDISKDDGRNWTPVTGNDRNWNALSLPFIVGPGGRIGKLLSGSAGR
jgi:photosystem II stability/assembly factor-like uncharacterized protein